MAEILVGPTDAMANGDRQIIEHNGVQIGVFRWEGEFFAYRNQCPHQGGPACEGLLMHRVEEVLDEDKQYRGQTWNLKEMHFVCPWHGYEFDMRTGECAADRRVRVRAYRTEVRGDELYVHA